MNSELQKLCERIECERIEEGIEMLKKMESVHTFTPRFFYEAMRHAKQEMEKELGQSAAYFERRKRKNKEGVLETHSIVIVFFLGGLVSCEKIPYVSCAKIPYEKIGVAMHKALETLSEYGIHDSYVAFRYAFRGYGVYRLTMSLRKTSKRLPTLNL